MADDLSERAAIAAANRLRRQYKVAERHPRIHRRREWYERRGGGVMLTAIEVQVLRGYTGCDHLIETADVDAAVSAVVGKRFRSAERARSVAHKAFVRSCDKRCVGARVVVTLRTATGDKVSVG